MLPLAHPHRLEHAIKRGEYADRADLAQQFGITQARETQLLNLTLLAPDIQKAAFKLEAINGVPPTSELVAQASLRSRERFWDIRVPKIDSIFDNSLVPRPSWSPGVPPQHRKLVAATHRSPI